MATGEVIRARRITLGLTQVDLAHAIGVDERTMRRIESGETPPTLEHARRLAVALEISLDELAGP